MDETLYLFVRPSAAPKFEITDPESAMVERWTRLIYNFACSG